MARRSTLNVSLTPALEKYIAKKVASGTYQSASEVIRESLRTLQAHERDLKELRKQIQVGIDELDRGEGIPLETALAQVREEINKRRRKLA